MWVGNLSTSLMSQVSQVSCRKCCKSYVASCKPRVATRISQVRPVENINIIRTLAAPLDRPPCRAEKPALLTRDDDECHLDGWYFGEHGKAMAIAMFKYFQKLYPTHGHKPSRSSATLERSSTSKTKDATSIIRPTQSKEH